MRALLIAQIRNRKGEVLLIDARKLGTMETRVWRRFTPDNLAKIGDTVQAWRQNGETTQTYADIAGFCKSATLAEIEKHGFVLTPGRYVGAEDVEEDAEPFAERTARLVATLRQQQHEGAKLDAAIAENLRRLGYGD